MKSKISISLILLSLFATSLAFSNDQRDSKKPDKVTIKTREAVAEAQPDDWKTLAEAAEKCIHKGVNLKEAQEWLDTSLKIKETALNLMVKGDYYASNNQPDRALEYYVKSLKVGKQQDVNFNGSKVQQKIAAIHFKK